MGMFDTLICDLPLPENSNLGDGEFQTKSLYKLDETYKIDMMGHLFKVGEEPYYLEFMKWTGSIVFYKVVNDTWFEYQIEFNDGKSRNVELVEKRILQRDHDRQRLNIAWAKGEVEN